MPTGGGDFERALGLRLAFDFGEIRIHMRGHSGRRFEARQLRFAAEVSDDFEQRAGGEHVRALRERGLGRVRFGQHERAPGCPRLQRHGKRAAHRTQLSCQ